MSELARLLPDVPALTAALDEAGYLADPGLATALYCAIRLPQPLLVEGEPGVGKTSAAQAVARVLGTELVRLQCYEGIDAAEALYEWNYPRQLLAIRQAEAGGRPVGDDELFSERYLMARPLLRALRHPGPRPAVLLIDEIDRADDEFEAFLLEMLSEAAVTIPELGTVRATNPPIVVLTSNRTRDVHDALKRRCLYHWIDFPDPERAAAIVRRHLPAAPAALVEQVTGAVGRLRALDLQKPPGVAEAIDWLASLGLLGTTRLDPASAAATLGSAVKYREDVELVRSTGLENLFGG
jgi:MoxR-like ATPase